MTYSNYTFDPNQYPLESGVRLLEASAGTGKTFSLAHLVLRLIAEKEYLIDEMLVISFTNATASEIKSKISSRLSMTLRSLEDYKDESKQNMLDDVMVQWLKKNANNETKRIHMANLLLQALERIDYTDITTIHGFCSRTIRREAIHTGSQFNPQPLTEEDNQILMFEVVHEYWREQILELRPDQIKGLLTTGLSVNSLVKYLSKIESDPSRKLKLKTNKFENLPSLADQFDSCVNTCWEEFINCWSNFGIELEQYLRNKAVMWKEKGVTNIKPFSPNPKRDRAKEVTEWIKTYSPKIKDGTNQTSISYDDIRRNLLLRDYFHPIKISEIEKKNNLDLSPLFNPSLQKAIADLWDKPAELIWEHALNWSQLKLIETKKRRGLITYSDQLRALDPGKDNDLTNSSELLLEKLRLKYKIVLVDEFQDTDPVQWRIINNAFGNSTKHFLLMVGDPKQSIYKFRGGDISTYHKAKSLASRIDSLITNYRASPELMQGLNTLMKTGLKNSCLEIPTLIAASKETPISLTKRTAPIEILNLSIKTPESTSTRPDLLSKTKIEEYIPTIVTTSIIELLEAHKEEITPEDICVLVNSHEQAESIRRVLTKSNLPTRLINKGDIFETEAAKVLQIFLDCLSNPSNTNNINLLACSPLIQWDLEKLKASDTNEGIDQLVLKCIELSKRVKTIGLLGCLSDLVESKNIADLSERGRLLGDLQQCAEIVQEEMHLNNHNSLKTARWFRQQRQSSIETIPEHRRPNSDIEENAINIITIHRSKGLQYKIVICPYLWQSPPIPKGPLWKPNNSEFWHFSLTPDWCDGGKFMEESINDSIAEAERLAYVALTRSQKKLIIIWSLASNQENNPLKYLLFGNNSIYGDSNDFNEQKMRSWINCQEGNIQVRTLTDIPKSKSWNPPKIVNDLSIGPRPKRLLDTSWGRYSYSTWISTIDSPDKNMKISDSYETGRDIDEDDVPTINVPSQKSTENLSVGNFNQSPLAEFPVGPIAGDCLHRILEKLSFEAPITDLLTTNLIKDELARSGIDLSMTTNVQQSLQRLMEIPVIKGTNEFKFNQLNSCRRISELKFDLSLSLEGKPITSKDLVKVFRENPKGKYGSKYADSLREINITSRGFLTGSIDLVFTDNDDIKNARWWIADWKSNWIGERDKATEKNFCSPSNYTKEALDKQMYSHHYPLQAHLYLVALHRYLNWRLDNYNPKIHLGGYMYIFLRGLPSIEEFYNLEDNANVPGLIIEKTPLERVISLDRLIRRGGE